MYTAFPGTYKLDSMQVYCSECLKKERTKE
jgi:hypothetical protein